ncbi:MAG: mechanosensitive ion channel domain-containing protein [Gammaproteobacteria bacterium]
MNKLILMIICIFLSCAAMAEPSASIDQNNLSTNSIVAQTNQEVLSSATQELIVTQQKNQLAQQRLNRLKSQQSQLLPQDVDQALVTRAKLDAALAGANLDSANITLAESQQATSATQAKIATLESELQNITLGAGKANAVRLQITMLQDELNFQKALLKIQTKELNELTKSTTIASQTYDFLVSQKDALANLNQLRIKQEQQLALQNQESELQMQQKTWLDRLAMLDQQIQNLPSTPDNIGANQSLELQILQAQEQTNLIHLQLVILHLQEQTTDLEQQQRTDVPSLNNVISQTNDILSGCNNLNDLIIRKQKLLTARIKLEKQSFEQALISKEQYEADVVTIQDLVTGYQKQLNVLNQLEQQTQVFLNAKQLELTKALARRQGLPGFSLNAWSSLGHEIVKIPGLAVESVLAVKDQVVLAINKVSLMRLLTIFIIEGLWLSIWFLLAAGVSRYANKITRKRDVAGNMLFIVLTLLKRNFSWIFGILAIFLLLWLLDLTTKSFAPFIALLLVWFIFKMIIDAAKLVLLETSATVSASDIRLYRELKYGFIAGGVLTMLMVIVHKLPVGYEVTDFFNRLFMLFMLVISTLLLRSWRVVPNIVRSSIAIGRSYLIRLVTILSFLVPLTFFTTALIGFLGYVDFAWTLSRYEGLFLLVLSVYMLLCGLWSDIIESISEHCIRSYHHGWLLTQLLLKPLDNLIRVGLFIGIFVSLFYLYGLTTQSYIIQLSNKILHFNLLQAKNAIITPLVIIQIIIAGIIIYWISRWTRELSFRWLFAKSQDPGLRNSLSAFSQYAVVLIGVLIALQVIGIDLTGISYVLGGLAFGAAFGLRDLVKNYASGLLLLIERPVRTGDLVSIGSFEGEVTQIGMRSMTLKTWDHMEVLVPNSETFDKPFTNWTHLDSIVRTVINLKISRDDDPDLVRELILSVLQNNSYIVIDPSPQIYLMEMDDALMEFEVRYFINLQQGKSRPAIRSEVLFAIYAIFKQHNIKLPYPPQDVYVRSLPNP